MSEVLLDVSTALAAEGIGLTAGTNLFMGVIQAPSKQVPIDSTFVGSSPGAAPERFMGEVSEIRRPMVHIRTRSSSFQTGDTRIRLIQDTMQALSISGYLDVKAVQSEPTYLGQTDEGHHLWVMSHELVNEEVK
jgi:hypothetical protein